MKAISRSEMLMTLFGHAKSVTLSKPLQPLLLVFCQRMRSLATASGLGVPSAVSPHELLGLRG